MDVIQVFRARTVLAVRQLGFIPLSLLLSACVGGGGSENDSDSDSESTPAQSDSQTGKIERSIDISGRWQLSNVMGKNSCGFPLESSQESVDVTQQGTKVTFNRSAGTAIMHGELSGDTFTSSTTSRVDIGGRAVVYSHHSNVTVATDFLMGEGSFTLQEGEGAEACSGQTLLQGTREVADAGVPARGMSEVEDHEPNDTLNNAASLALNAAVNGDLNAAADRVDVYAVELAQNGQYQVDLSGFGANDLDVALVDKYYNILATSENTTGEGERVAFNVDAAAGGVLYVIVTGYETEAAGSPYTLQVMAP